MLISVEGTGKYQVEPGQGSMGDAPVLSHLLPMILVRDQIRDMLGGYVGKFTFGRINYKFRTSGERNTNQYTIYWNTGESVDLKDVVVVVVVAAAAKFMAVYVARRNSAYS
jgi:hypothetical protein